MKNNGVFLACIIGMMYMSVDASEKIEAKQEKVAKVVSARVLVVKLASEACHKASTRVLSEGYDSFGRYITRTYDPGFEYKTTVRNLDGTSYSFESFRR